MAPGIADVNAGATVDEAGIGGQTAIFHAVTQFDDDGLPITQSDTPREAGGLMGWAASKAVGLRV
jgi:hypothetical protein